MNGQHMFRVLTFTKWFKWLGVSHSRNVEICRGCFRLSSGFVLEGEDATGIMFD